MKRIKNTFLGSGERQTYPESSEGKAEEKRKPEASIAGCGNRATTSYSGGIFRFDERASKRVINSDLILDWVQLEDADEMHDLNTLIMLIVSQEIIIEKHGSLYIYTLCHHLLFHFFF